MCSIMSSRKSTSCISRFRGLRSGLKLYKYYYRTLCHLDCQWQKTECLQLQCKALDEESLTGVYRSVRRSIPENLNIQSVKTLLLQQRLLEISQDSGCGDISTIVLSFALHLK